MRPVVLHNLPAFLLLVLTTIAALTTEGMVRARTASSGRSSPESSFLFLTLGALVLIVITWVAALEEVAPLPGGLWWPVIAGFTLMWMGIALRVWAVITLGRFFKLMIVIQDDHRLIEHGPYRHLRHPAYLATIIYSAGSGLVLGDWVSFLVMLVGTTIMFSLRIRVEDRALAQALGSEYVSYMQRTARLVPGIF